MNLSGWDEALREQGHEVRLIQRIFWRLLA
jgi:hypothetical protein